MIKLAARHGFEFSVEELSDSELQGVVGGFSDTQRGSDAQLANIDMQNELQKQQQAVQMIGSISKTLSDTAMSVSRKIGG